MGASLQIAHCKGRYYREFAYKPFPGEIKTKEGKYLDLFRVKYTPVRNDADLATLLHTYRGRPGVYISVYAFQELSKEGSVDYKSAIVDRIYLDFDCGDNPQKAVYEALVAMRSLIKHKVYPLACFSGKKGIALYIDFDAVEIAPENKKEVIARFFDLVIDTVEEDFGVDLDTLDQQVRGDIARVSRLPNTRHASGLYCIPLRTGDMRRGLDYIKKLAENPKDFDLGSVISLNVARNIRMPIILKNLEKVVVAERESEAIAERIRKRHFEYLASQAKKKRESARITEQDIERAKAVPISNFLGREKKVLCPFHPDGTPSLSINHEENLWHCFGCGKGGTVIDYVMEEHGVDFKAAVLLLLGRDKEEPKSKPLQRKPFQDNALTKGKPGREDRKEVSTISNGNVPKTNNQSPPSMNKVEEEKPAEHKAINIGSNAPEIPKPTQTISIQDRIDTIPLNAKSSQPPREKVEAEFSLPTPERDPSKDIKHEATADGKEGALEVLREFIGEWYGDGAPGHPEDPNVREIFVQTLIARCEEKNIKLTRTEAKEVVEAEFKGRGWI